jgi:hypothetical protein
MASVADPATARSGRNVIALITPAKAMLCRKERRLIDDGKGMQLILVCDDLGSVV